MMAKHSFEDKLPFPSATWEREAKALAYFLTSGKSCLLFSQA
jgi:hypothetical protein